MYIGNEKLGKRRIKPLKFLKRAFGKPLKILAAKLPIPGAEVAIEMIEKFEKKKGRKATPEEIKYITEKAEPSAQILGMPWYVPIGLGAAGLGLMLALRKRR